jgi:zinc/manganese transport system ATP-binding protein
MDARSTYLAGDSFRKISNGRKPGISLVELQDISLRLGNRTILEHLTFEVFQGEFIPVLGPNGAGKSTLLKLLLGLLKPAGGSIKVLGKAPKPGNSEIGYTPQHRQLEAELALRARDVVGFGLDGHRWGPGWPSRKRRAIIDQALVEVDALQFADAPVGQLSGGEQQRLLIAQALLSNPRLLLLDEPFASLDITHEQEIVTLLDRLRRERSMAVLLVSHDVNPLLQVADRVLYIARGHSAIGRPEDVITSATLSKLYGAPVEVVQALDRVFVVGVDI